LICPPDGLPALPHGTSGGLSESQSYAAIFNLLGYPAGVVPAGRVGEEEASDFSPSAAGAEKARFELEFLSIGLPVGIQVIARPWREDVALALMSALEQPLEAPSTPS
jgi:fatty acid amide hydrolase